MNFAPGKQLTLIALALTASALACALPGSQPEETATLEPVVDSTPTEELLPQGPEEEIVHVTFPADPAGATESVTDPSSAGLAAEHRTNADDFPINIYERPFTSEEMEYQDHLDIVYGTFHSGSPFYYVSVEVVGTPPDGSQAEYGVEIDLDIDGRGDLLVMGVLPPSTDWTTDGVRAYRDTNNDVGDFEILRIDEPDPAIDGYDELVFDFGRGDDPDAAWIRRHPEDMNVVQLALKRELLGNDTQFMWGVWADEGVREPAFYDYHDHFTLEEAGSPSIILDEYPLKALYSMDNTCRWGFGFETVGTEPGVCFIPPTPTPVPQGVRPPGSIWAIVFNDLDGSGSRDFGEPLLLGHTVTLGSGNCPSSGLDSGSAGSVTFADLPAGTYCVSGPSGSCSMSATTPTSRTINLPPDGNGFAAFGYTIQPC